MTSDESRASSQRPPAEPTTALPDVVIDAHQHIWDPSRADYPWLTSDLRPINRPISFDELRPALARVGVTGTVLVQSADNSADTDLMIECAARNPEILAVVAYAPLDRPAEAAPEIERYADDRRVVGVRTLIHNQADPDWLLRPPVQDGLGLLDQAGLSFDVVATLPHHLEAALVTADRYPSLPLILDHLGHPEFDEGDDQPWWDLMGRLSRRPNVCAKVSGLYPGATGPEGTKRIRPYFRYALETFGADRLMYGGDWPISVLHGGYEQTWRTLEPLLCELSESERRRLLAGTAVGVYRIDRERSDRPQRP